MAGEARHKSQRRNNAPPGPAQQVLAARAHWARRGGPRRRTQRAAHPIAWGRVKERHIVRVWQQHGALNTSMTPRERSRASTQSPQPPRCRGGRMCRTDSSKWRAGVLRSCGLAVAGSHRATVDAGRCYHRAASGLQTALYIHHHTTHAARRQHATPQPQRLTTTSAVRVPRGVTADIPTAFSSSPLAFVLSLLSQCRGAQTHRQAGCRCRGRVCGRVCRRRCSTVNHVVAAARAPRVVRGVR